MKTLRMSRSAHDRNARKDMAKRGRAGGSRITLFDPDVILTGRRFRRANRLTRAEAAAFDIFANIPKAEDGRTAVVVDYDPYTRQAIGLRMT